MKKMSMVVPLACACVGVGTLMYSYMQKHPVKAQVIKNDVKNMMKDLK